MSYLDLPQVLSARGVVRLPGSKSISNRLLLLAALAEGTTEIHHLLQSDDTARMLDGLRALGVRVTSTDNGVFCVEGSGGCFGVRSADLFLGNAGTAFRPLTAVLALSGGAYTLSGTARMHERPIGDLVEALRQMGADITYLGCEGYPPLRIRPAQIAADATIKLRGDVSSQFLTGVLMALPLLGQQLRVEVTGTLISRPYVEITLAMMARFGVVVEREGAAVFVVPGASRYVSPGLVHVEGDASSASYFLALGALGGGPVRVEGVGSASVQGDVGFVDVLSRMGARVTVGDQWIELASHSSGLRGIEVDCNAIPDAAMTLATLALFAEGTTVLRNIASWRVKETDRIAAMGRELRKLGAEVEEGEDFLRVTPPLQLRSPPEGIDTYDDHRMAMCFSLVAFGVPLRINDPGCVAKTFPEYFLRWAEVTEPVPVIAIDGPSASGKGSVAMRVAEILGWHYLDSGILYRLLALAAHRAGVSWEDASALADVAARLDVVFAADSVRLAGEPVGDVIRSEFISSGASQVALFPAVREALLFRQRVFRCSPGLVADGRDIGSVVFPDAAVKVFLTASAEVRAERRYKQLIEKGIDVTMTSILRDLHERDERDSMRCVAPLQQSAGAELLDTSDLSMMSVVERVLSMAMRCCKEVHLPDGK